MSWLASLVLYLIHRLYSLAIFFSRLSQLVHSSSPLPIDAPRRLLPKHVAIIFFAEEGEQGGDDREEEDEMIVETICKCVDWCQAAGIARLSIYDRHGNAIRCSSRIQKYLYASETSLDEDSTTHTRIIHTETKIDRTIANNEYEYPLTPPATDSSSESRSHSPDSESKETELDPATIIEYEVPARPVGSSSLLRSFAGKRKRKGQGNGLRRRQSKGVADQQQCMSKRNPLQLSFLSYATSKPSLAAIARSLVRSRRVARRLLARANDAVEDGSASLTVDALERAIQESTLFPPPDLLLVHHFRPTGPLEPPLELDGFPPWQIRLTEMRALSKWRLGPWRNEEDRWNRLEEVAFREALDEFAGAEMRLGK